jgi:hypothetical protein
VPAEAERTVWKIHNERPVDETRHLRLTIASVELPDGVQFARIQSGEIIGAASLVGLLHVLAFPQP